MHVRRLFAVAATAISVLAVGAWSAQSPHQSVPPPPALNGMPLYQVEFPVLQSYVIGHPDQFGGAYVDGRSHTVYVDVAGADPSATGGLAVKLAAASRGTEHAAASVRGQAYSIAVRMVRYSQRQLDATKAEIATLQPWAAQAGPFLAAWGSDAATDTVSVGLTKLTPELEAAARTAFGDRVTLVQKQRPESAISETTLRPGYRVVHVARRALPKTRSLALAAGVAPQPSRLLDESPYYGGDRIYRLVVGSTTTTIIQCTTGFAWSTPAMSTAGHCGPAGTVWTQGYYDPGSNTLYNAGYIGTAFSVQWGQSRPDIELMNNAADPSASLWYPFVYTNLQTSALVGGYATLIPMLGQPVCVDGSFTGENCAGVVTAPNQSVIINTDQGPVTVTFADEANTTVTGNGSRLCQAGDSGGSVYSTKGAPVTAFGTIFACNEGTPANPGPGNDVWYADISTAVPIMNAGPVWTVPQQP